MTAKEFLSQAYWLDLKIESDLQELGKLQSMLSSVQAIRYDGIRVDSTSSGEAPFVKRIEKVIELEEKINNEIDSLVDLKEKIRATIEKVANPDLKLLLLLRYVNHMSWEEIAVKMNYTVRNIHFMHSNALKEVQQYI